LANLLFKSTLHVALLDVSHLGGRSMGVSKPQEYCQELQLAVGRAKLPGYFGACALSNRNEQLNLQKRTYFVGTEAPLSQESGQRYQKSYTPRR